MNDLLFLQDVAALLSGSGYADLATALTPAATTANPEPVPSIFAAQAAANTARPILVVSAPQGFTQYGPRRKGTLRLELRGRTGDETAEGEHQARWMLLWAALLGALGATREETAANLAAAKSALIAAVAARGHTTLVDYGPSGEEAVISDVDGADLRTVLQLRVAWSFTQAS